MLKLAPVPDAGDPPVAVHANVYGAVPPVAVAVHATGLLTVPVAGQLIDTDRAVAGLIVTDAELDAVAAFVSVAVTDIVLLPFTL